MPWSNKSIQDAISEAKLKGAIFVVYVEDDSGPTSLHETVQSPEVSNLLESDNFIVIKIGSKNQSYTDFTKIYQFVPVPSLFFIGQNGWPIEIISCELSRSSVIQRINNLLEQSDQLHPRSDIPEEYSVTSPMNATVGSSSESSIDRTSTLSFESVAAAEVKPSDAGFLASASTSASSEPLLSNLMTSAYSSSSTSPVVSVDSDLVGVVNPSGSNVSLNESATVSNACKSDMMASAQCSEGEVFKVREDEESSQILSNQNFLDNERNQDRKSQNDSLSAENLNMEDYKSKPDIQPQETVSLPETMSEPDVQPQETVSLPEMRYSQKFMRLPLHPVSNEENQHHSTTRLQSSRCPAEMRSNFEERMSDVFHGGRPTTLRASQDVSDQRNETSCVPSVQADGVERDLDSDESWPEKAQIQFRLPDGSTYSHTFMSRTTIAEMHTFIRSTVSLPFRDFRLSTSYPRIEFTDEHGNTPIGALGLAPRSVILIIPGSEVSLPSGLPATFGALWAIILWPFTAMYSLFTYLNVQLFGATDPAVSDTSTAPSQSTLDQPSSSVASSQSSSRNLSGARRRVPASSTIQRDGNVHRLSNRPDDSDEDNNTWNGNSTQQM